MALINCPECGKEISDKAQFCINCGFPLQDKNNETKPTINNANVDKYNIFLMSCGERKIKVIQYIMYVLNNSLENAKIMSDHLPCAIKRDIDLEEAEKIKKIFEDCGATIAIEKTDSTQSIKEKYNPNILCCPRCSSESITTGQRGFSIWTGFLGSNKTVNRCGKCGYSWEPK